MNIHLLYSHVIFKFTPLIKYEYILNTGISGSTCTMHAHYIDLSLKVLVIATCQKKPKSLSPLFDNVWMETGLSVKIDNSIKKYKYNGLELGNNIRIIVGGGGET